MKNLILKSIPIMGIMVCLLSNNIMVNASEEKESNEMPMIAIDSQEYGINGNIMPMKTITGNAGSCTLDYVDRSIQWAVKPKTTKKYLFIGNIRIVTAKTNDAKGSGSVSASGKLKNSKDESKTIAYKIMDGNKEFSTATYAESGNSTNLTLSIDKSEWDKAYAGSYSDTLVFTISYR